MERPTLETPDVTLGPAERIRFAIIAVLVAFLVLRVVPDAIRVYIPLHTFGYATDGAGVIISVSHVRPAPKGDILAVGDRIRVDRIAKFDRKPGIVGTGYSRDNPERTISVVRNDRERVLHVGSRPENIASRIIALVRILVFLVSLGLAAMLFLLRPSVATGALFFYCLGAEAPTSYSEVVLDNPWQQIPVWLADCLHGAARAALLAFGLSLISANPRYLRIVAIGCAVTGLLLGNLNATTDWLAIYAGRPRPEFGIFYVHASSVLAALAIAAFAFALVRARARERKRMVWTVAAFALAGLARVASDAAYPIYLAPWQNGLLLTATILPIGVVWFSVLRHRFFNVDFVVGRAIVYVALTGAVVGTITLGEEIGTYVFYQNTDLAYGFLIVISTFIGMGTGRIRSSIEAIVDRFVFRDRHERRIALELISGYVLDAEQPDDVYRALLEDTTHALSLHFAGIIVRRRDGTFELERECRWPRDLTADEVATHDIVQAISRSRATLEPPSKRNKATLQAKFDPRLSLVAPLFAHRRVVALVAYGRNVSGLNLNGDERERLARLVAHASLALGSIELAQARDRSVPDALIAIEP